MLLVAQIGKAKVRTYHFIQYLLGVVPLRKEGEQTGWKRLIEKIATIKQHGQIKEYQNREFVVHIFCQVSCSYMLLKPRCNWVSWRNFNIQGSNKLALASLTTLTAVYKPQSYWILNLDALYMVLKANLSLDLLFSL